MADHPTKSDGSPDPEADIVAGDGTDNGGKNHVRDAQLAGRARVQGGCDEHRLPWNGDAHALDCDGTTHDPGAISTDGVGQSRIKRHEGSPLSTLPYPCRVPTRAAAHPNEDRSGQRYEVVSAFRRTSKAGEASSTPLCRFRHH